MSKITIVSAVHGREYLWDMWLRSLRYVTSKMHDKGFDISVVIACSTEREAEYFSKNGCVALVTGNEWLGEKWNHAIEYAWEHDAEYVMMLGSDDFVNPKLIDLYLPYIKQKNPFFGIERMYILDWEKDVIKEFNGWSGNQRIAFGAAKMIHKKALNVMGGRPGREKVKRGLDTYIMTNLRYKGIEETIVPTNDYYVIDVKTKDNINPISAHIGVEYTPDYYKLREKFNIQFKIK